MIGQVPPEAPYGIFAQYGLAGLFAFLLWRRYESELARERARADRAEAQADAVIERAISDLAPLVAEAARTMVPALGQMTAEVARMRERLDRLDRDG